ncbi:hypothetical protein DFH27DRAFT_552076 [Peziza echinospora]|nr:hypothetical protein DFH27DRAFT_552076 [Peziza echinospora]
MFIISGFPFPSSSSSTFPCSPFLFFLFLIFFSLVLDLSCYFAIPLLISHPIYNSKVLIYLLTSLPTYVFHVHLKLRILLVLFSFFFFSFPLKFLEG